MIGYLVLQKGWENNDEGYEPSSNDLYDAPDTVYTSAPVANEAMVKANINMYRQGLTEYISNIDDHLAGGVDFGNLVDFLKKELNITI
jgi:hypothetical protein